MSDKEFGEIGETGENPLFQPDSDEIFDERQERLRDKITIKVTNIFVRLWLVNIIIMEQFYQWCESYLLSSYLILAIALLFWHIKNGVNGSLFGVEGVGKRVGEATVALLVGVFAVLITVPVFALGDDDIIEHFFIHDGMVSNYVTATAALILIVADSAAIYVLAIRHKLKEKSDKKQ